MGRWRTEAEQWLTSERRELDEAADAAFAQVFSALPAVEPSPGFVQRAVDAAWQTRARRRSFAMAAAAAALLTAVASGVAVYSLLGTTGPLLSQAAALATGFVVTLSSTVTTVAGWWWAATRAAGPVADFVVRPLGAATFVAIEFVGVAALYMLHRLLRSDVRFRDPGMLCV